MTASPSSSFFDAPDASKTDEIQRSKGGTLFTRDWEVPEPRGLAFISHGFSEHTKYYNEVAQALNGKKIYCFGHDHLGHGRSSGSRTLINSTDEYVEDVLHHVKLLQKKFPTLPMFIVAHSMGGLIALRCALIYPDVFKGVVLIGPLIIPLTQVGGFDFRITSRRAPFFRSFLKAIDVFSPEFIIGMVELPQVSREKELQDYMAHDELKWNRGMKVRTLLAMVDTLEENYNLLSSMKVPFLTIHGQKDKICNVKGSRILLKKAMVEDKAILEIPEAVHNLLMEEPKTREDTVSAVVKWIDERC